ncbi:TonB dependent/Ligand-Gated channels [Proteiniphilum saccharofermentans]|uniref:TonB dependent/Ligand-Gated channels n=1 Tax=Proteiniphilum saccharofermentans TaxID=1642647 RepID=A0A1R3SWG4_9BACT|nr:TonB-dependent receptor [Proteiniphilum saccharofermentans]SCD19881.1 TonB dependent/Ligand-Gated channels [Proteiniphilum saccharofermentans]
MYKITLLLYCIVLSASPLAAGNSYSGNEPAEALNDTIRLDEVIVTGTMPKVNLRNLPISISVISGNQIEERIQPNILPLLTEEVPGLFITQRGVMGYGVANGAAGGMSMRGIGGAPTTGVLVLIDGHPQYMGLMGHPLADSYQSMMTERVEVVRGPASVLYGSNAMGGVINIITKKQQRDGSHGMAQVMYGSYNTLNAEAYTGWKKERLHLVGNIGYSRSDGHRENMDFEQWNGYAKVGYDISRHWKSFADLNISNTESSNPGMVTAPMIDNDADITRGMTSLAVENEYANTSGAVKLFYNFGTHRINDGYAEGEQPRPFRFNSSDRMAGVSLYQSYSFFTGNKTTAGFDYQHFGGEAKNKFPDESDNVQLADTSLYNMAGYLNLQQTILNNKLTLNAGIRLDHHQINGSEWIPQLGASFTPSATTVLKAIVSKGFRNPTIREMYMFPPQNPDLKAERLMNYEVSLLQMLMDNRLSLGVNLFYIKGDNMIQQPQPNMGQWVNIGEVENKGFELSASYQAMPNLRFSANYSYLNMTYKILTAPEHKLYVSGSYTKGPWGISSGVQYIGNIYTSPSDTRQETFVLWNVRANYQLLDWLNLFIKGENLLDQKYEINVGYPMPGATLFGGVRVKI